MKKILLMVLCIISYTLLFHIQDILVAFKSYADSTITFYYFKYPKAKSEELLLTYINYEFVFMIFPCLYSMNISSDFSEKGIYSLVRNKRRSLLYYKNTFIVLIMSFIFSIINCTFDFALAYSNMFFMEEYAKLWIKVIIAEMFLIFGLCMIQNVVSILFGTSVAFILTLLSLNVQIFFSWKVICSFDNVNAFLPFLPFLNYLNAMDSEIGIGSIILCSLLPFMILIFIGRLSIKKDIGLIKLF